MSFTFAFILRNQKRSSQKVRPAKRNTDRLVTPPALPDVKTRRMPNGSDDDSIDAALARALYVGPGFREKRLALKRWREQSGRVGVIADFDRTLTDASSVECHGVIASSSTMPPEFRHEMDRLLDFHDPVTNSLSADEWWHKANSLMITHNLRRDMLEEIIETSGFVPRAGLWEFLSMCRMPSSSGQPHTPLLIVSAGLSDLIETFLRRYEALSFTSPPLLPASKIFVSANRMVFEDGGGRVVSWLPDAGPCHSHNKKDTFRRESTTPGGFFFHGDDIGTPPWSGSPPSCPSLTQTPSSGPGAGVRHWVVLGDKPHDVNASLGLPLEMKNVELRIGFLDIDDDTSGSDSKLGEYSRAYDLVLPSVGTSLGPIVSLLKEGLHR